MNQITADLHIHSYYSDGTMSPKEILTAAHENGVSLISITDHDVLDGSRELKKLCETTKIGFLSGIEMNSLNNGKNIHILGYGIDLNDKEFGDFVQKNRNRLDCLSVELIEKMQEDYDTISISDYMNYTYDRSKGGWKALHYLFEKGVTKNLREAFPLYTKYNCNYNIAGFPTVQSVCEAIHKAGGIAILAHPGVTIKEKDLKMFQKELIKLIDLGVDGVECYYPTHRKEITQVCLDVCNQRNLLITSGSDCHGTFGDAEVGEMNTPIEKLKLGEVCSENYVTL